MDVDNLLAGQKFDDELAKALSACNVLVAVIGARWMDVLQTKTETAAVDPDFRDYVREEIAAALKRGIVVIPVRVGRDGTLPALPRPSELPDDIRALVAHQKHDITHERFGRDVGDLADAISAVGRGGKDHRWFWLAAAVILGVAATVVGFHVTGVAPWLPKAKIDAELEAKAPNFFERFHIDSWRDTLTDGSPCPACPDMVMVPAGNFTMGSPDSEDGRSAEEGPQRLVKISQPLAVGKFEVTFAEWEGCVAGGGCQSNKTPSDQGWGKGRRPVINVSWNDAKEYVAWLSKATGQPYRLLS
jgi:hypothetical protein